MARQVGFEVSETPVRLRYVRAQPPAPSEPSRCAILSAILIDRSNVSTQIQISEVFGRFLDARDRRAARSANDRKRYR